MHDKVRLVHFSQKPDILRGRGISPSPSSSSLALPSALPSARPSALPRCWFFLRRPLFGRLCLCLPRAPPCCLRPPPPPEPPWPPCPPAGRPNGRPSMGSPNDPLSESSLPPKGTLPEEPLLEPSAGPLRAPPSAEPLRPPPAPSAEPRREPPNGLPKGVPVSSESSESPHGSGVAGAGVDLGRGVRNLQDGDVVVLNTGVRATQRCRVLPIVVLGEKDVV